MASSLRDQLSCPVCSKPFQDPQLLSCGHRFCRRCLDELCTFRSTWTCPVCHRVTLQKSLANLVLRNACESYLREKETESDGEVRCSRHGEKVNFFCETDEEAICSECRKQTHSSHRVQNITHTVRQRKSKVKAALRPAEKALESLCHGTTRHNRICRYIQFQAQKTERLIRKDFETLRQFLQEEEDKSIAALREEEDRKMENVEERVEQQIVSLWDKVRDVEDELENDDATFLQNFNSILQRAQYTVSDPELDSGALIDEAKYLGNLRYRVWKKMKDICPYYTIILNPTMSFGDFSISDDLACVGRSANGRPSPFPHCRNQIVLGSEGFTNGYHCWDIEVGNSRNWTIGVCRGTSARRPVEDLTPANGFWGLCCERGVYKVLGSMNTEGLRELDHLWRNEKNSTVQVKLGQHLLCRSVSFYDARNGFMIGSKQVPKNEELFPFLVPGEQPSVLRIQQEHVTVTVKEKLNLIRRFIDVDERMSHLFKGVVIGVGLLLWTLFIALVWCSSVRYYKSKYRVSIADTDTDTF